MDPSSPVAPQMWIESETGGIIRYPSPRQAAEVARGLGGPSGRLVVLVVGDRALAATTDRAGRFTLEHAGVGRTHQALSVSLGAVVDAFERFAAGDESRDPSLRWSLVETRLWAAVASGVQRLPEGFYEIAPRLRAGDRPLDIRNEIMAAAGLSKLAAAKRVEEVLKLLRLARAAAGGGLLFSGWLAFSLATSGWSPLPVLIHGTVALAQFAFAGYIYRESRPPARG